MLPDRHVLPGVVLKFLLIFCIFFFLLLPSIILDEMVASNNGESSSRLLLTSTALRVHWLDPTTYYVCICNYKCGTMVILGELLILRRQNYNYYVRNHDALISFLHVSMLW